MPDDLAEEYRRQEEIKSKARELAEVVLRGTGMSPDEAPVLVQSLGDVLRKWQEQEGKKRKPS